MEEAAELTKRLEAEKEEMRVCLAEAEKLVQDLKVRAEAERSRAEAALEIAKVRCSSLSQRETDENFTRSRDHLVLVLQLYNEDQLLVYRNLQRPLMTMLSSHLLVPNPRQRVALKVVVQHRRW